VIDSHCHLDLPAFASDRGAVLARAIAAGVRGILVPAIRPSTWAALTALPHAHPGAPLALALGIHPQIVPDLAPSEIAMADDFAAAMSLAMTDRVVAIGECGLDGGTGDHPLQERLFRAQLRAARELRLPVVIHVLRAHDVAPRILREEQVGDYGGVVHSFSGSAELVSIYTDLGLHLSFAGAVTRATARRPIAAARVVPLAALLAETDGPDQTPSTQPRGRNEPAFVVDVIAALAQARAVSASDLAAATTANARRLFPRAAPWW
jgi:TatD DNase family protein